MNIPSTSSGHTHQAHSLWDEFWEHARLSLIVASMVGLLHHAGVLQWLDAAMLYLTGEAHASRVVPSETTLEAPTVLLINETLYESEFGQRSPLDRQKLATLFKTIAPTSTGGGTTSCPGPKAVVVDIDISGLPGNSQPDALDSVLECMVKGGVRLVLPLPIGVDTADFLKTKKDWIKKACGWRPPTDSSAVVFARTDVHVNAGRVLQFDKDAFTLGVAAPRPSPPAPPTPSAVCDLALGRAAPEGRLDVLLQSVTQDMAVPLALGTGHPQYKPFNAHFTGATQSSIHALDSLNRLPAGADGKPLNLSGKVVFLGGSYDTHDRFSTPLAASTDPLEGVVLHAATHFSLAHPVTKEEGFLALGIEFLIGIALGFIFHRSWGLHTRALQHRATAGGWSGYAAPIGSLALNFLVAAVIVVMLVGVTITCLYPNNYWISPGPMVLGMIPKFIIASRLPSPTPAQRELPAGAKWLNAGVIMALALTNACLVWKHTGTTHEGAAHAEHSTSANTGSPSHH